MNISNNKTSKKGKNYAEHVVKGSALIFFMAVVTNIIGYLIRIFLARSLTPADYGLVYAAISLLGLLNVFRNLGFSDTLRKKVPEYMVKRNFVKIKSATVLTFLIQLAYMFVIFLIVFVFAEALSGGLFGGERGIDVLIILALSGLASVVFKVTQSVLQGLHRVGLYTSIDFSIYALRIIFIIAFIPFGILALPYAYLSAAIIVSIISYLIFRFKFSFIAKAKTRISRKFSKEILYFSTPIMIGYVASSVVANIDTILLSVFRTLEEVALYQVALPLAHILLIVASAITVVLMPLLSELWTKKRFGTIKEMLGLLTKALFIIVIPLALILIAFPANVISMLFGETYVAASFVLQILSFGMIIMTLNYVFASSIIGIGKPGLNTKIGFVMMGISIVFNLALIPLLGIIGAAIAVIISTIVGFVLYTYFAIKYVKVVMQWLNLLKIFVGGLLTLLIIFAIKTILVTNPWLELIAALVIGFVFYLFFVPLSRSITKNEIKILTSIKMPIPKFLARFAMRITQ